MWQTAPHNAVSHWFSTQRKADTLPIISAEVPALIASGGAYVIGEVGILILPRLCNDITEPS